MAKASLAAARCPVGLWWMCGGAPVPVRLRPEPRDRSSSPAFSGHQHCHQGVYSWHATVMYGSTRSRAAVTAQTVSFGRLLTVRVDRLWEWQISLNCESNARAQISESTYLRIFTLRVRLTVIRIRRARQFMNTQLTSRRNASFARTVLLSQSANTQSATQKLTVTCRYTDWEVWVISRDRKHTELQISICIWDRVF